MNNREVMMSGQASGRNCYEQVLSFIVSRLQRAGAVFSGTDLIDLDFDSVGIDSLELTELIMELEEQFGVTIDDSILSGSTTVAQLAAGVARDLGANHGD